MKKQPFPPPSFPILLATALALGLLVSSVSTFAQAGPTAEKTTVPPAKKQAAQIVWHEAGTPDWKPEGRAWDDTPAPFSRLPARAKGQVTTAVWRLSQQSSGMVMRFKTDAPRIRVRHSLGGPLAREHMTAVSVSGLDLYAKDDTGAWRWAGITKPASKTYEQNILEDAIPAPREYALHLPLYNNTVSLSVGVPEGCRFEALPPLSAKPLVYYGTSITQGCSASRPGMTVSALLGRRLGLPVVNLGFSGSGKMEPEMCALVAEIDAAVFVLDCLPNMCVLEPSEITRRTLAGVRAIRAAHPATPILLVEDRTYGNAWLVPGFRERNERARRACRLAHDTLVQEGVTGVVYLEGDSLIGEEATIDGSHMSDLGMMRQMEVMLPVLQRQLGR